MPFTSDGLVFDCLTIFSGSSSEIDPSSVWYDVQVEQPVGIAELAELARHAQGYVA